MRSSLQISFSTRKHSSRAVLRPNLAWCCHPQRTYFPALLRMHSSSTLGLHAPESMDWIGLGPMTAILCFYIYIFSVLTTDKRW